MYFFRYYTLIIECLYKIYYALKLCDSHDFLSILEPCAVMLRAADAFLNPPVQNLYEIRDVEMKPAVTFIFLKTIVYISNTKLHR